MNTDVLSFPIKTPPATDGTLIEVAPGILWLRMPLPLALNHINLYLLRDDDSWMLVDTGIATDETRELWRKIVVDALVGERISGVICTHYHFDHAGLAGWLTDWLRIPLYMSYGEYYTVRTMAQARSELSWQHREYFHQTGFPTEQLESVLAVINMAHGFVSPPPTSFRRLRQGECLRIGGRDWQLLVGEGHTSEHIVLHCAQDHLLLAGDQLLPRITSNVAVLPGEPDGNPLADWLASLDRFAQLPEETLVLPAHELPFYGVRPRIAQLHAHHMQQLARLRQVCAGQPCTAYAATQVLYPHCKTPMDEMMAMGECLAHLNYLYRRDEVERQLDVDGCYRYRLKTD